MENPQHTDGTWTRDGITVSVFGRGVVAQCPLPQDGGTMEAIGNARLIAAAPALLAALTAIIALRDVGHPKGGDLDANVAFRQAERDADKAARAAIAKAEKS